MTSGTTTDPMVAWMPVLCDVTREMVAKPWTLVRDGDPWTVATNGRLLVMTRGDFGFDPCPKSEEFLRVLARPTSSPVAFPMADLRALIVTPAPPAELPPCETCDSTGKIQCEECDGAGDVACECLDCGNEHEKECEACDGEGWKACKCGRIAAREKEPVTCKIGGAVFNLNLIRPAIDHLPDAPATWRQGEPGRGALLAVDRWTVLWMPLRDNTHTHEITLGGAA